MLLVVLEVKRSSLEFVTAVGYVISARIYIKLHLLIFNFIKYVVSSLEIIFFLESQHSGHWTALLRYSNVFVDFDSYGFNVDYDLTHWLTPLQRLKLGESRKYRSYLLQGRNYIYNTVKYQQMKPNVNTCGSHVAYRCHKFKTAGFNLKDYQQRVYK